MKITVGVLGSSVIWDPQMEELAIRTGMLIAERGAILITGATTGYSFAAARGAHAAGGEVIGFSPALNRKDHVSKGLPVTDHSLIVYTGLSSHGRNILNVRASNAAIFIGGSMGTMNELTLAYDEEKIIGILEGSGGFCNHLKEWMPALVKAGNRSIIHYAANPDRLIDQVFATLRDSLTHPE
ncbi:LOG family protein [bacterium]|nr:LOG family protein [bacterium]MCI0613059.1 LOG family protein [bacterium]